MWKSGVNWVCIWGLPLCLPILMMQWQWSVITMYLGSSPPFFQSPFDGRKNSVLDSFSKSFVPPVTNMPWLGNKQVYWLTTVVNLAIPRFLREILFRLDMFYCHSKTNDLMQPKLPYIKKTSLLLTNSPVRREPKPPTMMIPSSLSITTAAWLFLSRLETRMIVRARS